MPGGVTTDVKTYSMLINGEWVASKSAKTFPVYDPSTEEVIAQVPDANADDVNRAVAAAKAAFEEGPWATTTAQERGACAFSPRRKGARRISTCWPSLNAVTRASRLWRLSSTSRCGDMFRILRRAGNEGGRLCKSGSRQRHEPFTEGADGRCRADHSVELSADDGGVETGSGAGCGLHVCAQTSGANSAHRA
jgi:hypothetical protein